MTITETLAQQLLENLWAIYSIEQIGSRYLRQLDRAHFTALVEPLFVENAPDFILGGAAARDALFRFFVPLRDKLNSFPREWQREFRAAFDRGELDAAGLGAATRKIYCTASPGPTYRGEWHAETLENLRLSDPVGLMFPSEQQFLDELPEQVIIYRGALTNTPEEAAQGLSWSLDRTYAAVHLYRRTLPWCAATDIQNLLGLPSPPPRLVKVEAPKSALLLYRDAGDCEVIVDYEKLDPTRIVSLPTNDLLYQGVVGKIRKMGLGLAA